ncbi:MAG: nascent polypeptide-associated complex protein [Candidatus Pacearchaeota archaeon]|nr:nascent polypeptide-associated complex protein [Candidatus Pacearchaeota archaeon]
MFPGVDPRQMQGMLKKMGISQEDIDASRVIIEKTDNSKIIIENPSVQKIKMQGQETFQIAGDISEEYPKEETSEEDIQTIVEKTGVSKKKAREILEKNNGDLAETILKLSE